MENKTTWKTPTDITEQNNVHIDGRRSQRWIRRNQTDKYSLIDWMSERTETDMAILHSHWKWASASTHLYLCINLAGKQCCCSCRALGLHNNTFHFKMYYIKAYGDAEFTEKTRIIHTGYNLAFRNSWSGEIFSWSSTDHSGLKLYIAFNCLSIEAQTNAKAK